MFPVSSQHYLQANAYSPKTVLVNGSNLHGQTVYGVYTHVCACECVCVETCVCVAVSTCKRVLNIQSMRSTTTFERLLRCQQLVFCRSHDVKIGKQFYSRLKALRDALGLQFRFEVIFDDGSHLLSVGDHFMERLTKWGATCTTHPTFTTTSTTSTTTAASDLGSTSVVSSSPKVQQQEHPGHMHASQAAPGGAGDSTGGSSSTGGEGLNQNGGLLAGGCGSVIHSYKELEHLPCVVVLAGTLRAGLSFPR